jgi:rhodanese-related sulfurtransferase
MRAARFSISRQDLWTLIGSANAPQVIDVRRREVYDAAAGVLPSARWRNSAEVAQWGAARGDSRPMVLACKAGKELSQRRTAHLWPRPGCRVLEGGHEGWAAAGLPLVSKAALPRFAPGAPSLWVTRRRPKVDRAAGPWFIRRFIDPGARFLFVDPDQVPNVARETGGVPLAWAFRAGPLRHGFVVYDALVAYLRFAAEERHNWPAKAA